MVTKCLSRSSGRLPGPSDGLFAEPSTIRIRIRRGFIALALGLSLAACESSEPEPERVSTAETGGEEPNLGDVPSEAPTTSTIAERRASRQGLVADRAQARYSDETLTGEGLVGTAPGLDGAAPPPSGATGPAAPPFSSIQSSSPQTAGQPANGQIASRAEGGQPSQFGSSGGAVQAAPAPAPQASQPQQTFQQAPVPQAPAQPAPVPQTPAQQAAVPQPGAQAPPQPVLQTPPIQQSALQQGPIVRPFSVRQPFTSTPSQIPSPGVPGGAPGFTGGPPVLLGVIYFNHGSTALSKQDLAILRQVVALHRERGGVLRIVGHASQRTGQANPDTHQQINQRLSQRRADSVARALRGFGMAPGAVIAEARGDRELIFHEFMPTGEAGNRRVEIFLQL